MPVAADDPYDLKVTPSTLEVDYDKNLTDLYQAITDQNWLRATHLCRSSPVQAATWVVRHYNGDQSGDEEQEEIMWRFLPIHSACARQPPSSFLSALIEAYPDGARCVDDQGMYALHYACGNQASRDVVRQLLAACPQAAKIPDPRGMLPIHYLACWGPSTVPIVDMMLVANNDLDLANARDADGKTPLNLAMEGDYPTRDQVVSILKKWTKSHKQYEGEDERMVAATRRIARSSTPSSHYTMKTRSTYAASPKSHGEKYRLDGDEYEEEKRDFDDLPPFDSRQQDKKSMQMERDLLQTKMELMDVKDTLEAKEKELNELKKSQQELDTKEGMKDEQIRNLERQIRDQRAEITNLKSESEQKKVESDKRSERVSDLEAELEEIKAKLRRSNQERDGLRKTLGDMMEQQDSYQKKAGNMNERLTSLSTNIDSMLHQQKLLEKTVQERTATMDDLYDQRTRKLKELLDMEDDIKKNESQLASTLQKQTRELEAISAVIKAAKD